MDEKGMNKSQHVVPNRDGGWAVRSSGLSGRAGCFNRRETLYGTPENLHARNARRCTSNAVIEQSLNGTATAQIPYCP